MSKLITVMAVGLGILLIPVIAVVVLFADSDDVCSSFMPEEA